MVLLKALAVWKGSGKGPGVSLGGLGTCHNSGGPRCPHSGHVALDLSAPCCWVLNNSNRNTTPPTAAKAKGGASAVSNRVAQKSRAPGQVVVMGVGTVAGHPATCFCVCPGLVLPPPAPSLCSTTSHTWPTPTFLLLFTNVGSIPTANRPSLSVSPR